MEIDIIKKQYYDFVETGKLDSNERSYFTDMLNNDVSVKEAMALGDRYKKRLRIFGCVLVVVSVAMLGFVYLQFDIVEERLAFVGLEALAVWRLVYGVIMIMIQLYVFAYLMVKQMYTTNTNVRAAQIAIIKNLLEQRQDTIETYTYAAGVVTRQHSTLHPLSSPFCFPCRYWSRDNIVRFIRMRLPYERI